MDLEAAKNSHIDVIGEVGFASMQYAIPYLLTGVFFLSLSVLPVAQIRIVPKWVIWLLCLFAFVFFFGLRGGVGYDCCSFYLPLFDGSHDDLAGFLENDREKGFLTLTWVLGQFICDGNVYLCIMTIIDACLLHFFFRRYSINYAFSFFLFFSINMIFEIDLLRNAKAIFIAMLAMSCVNDRRFVWYALLVILASLFHNSAIIYLPLYPVLVSKFDKRILWTVFVFANVIYFSQIPLGFVVGKAMGILFSERLEAYVTGEYSSAIRGITLGYFPRIIPFLVVMVLYDRFFKRFSYANLIFNLYLCYMVIGLVVGDLSELMRRISHLFEPAVWVIWPMILSIIPEVGTRLSLMLFIVLYGFSKIIIQTASPIFEYQNILLQPEAMTVEERKITKDAYHEGP